MKSTYDEELNEIIHKYDYYAPPFANSTKINGIILDLFCTRCNQKKTAIWGVGKNNIVNSHAAVIISKYALELNRLSHLIDSSKDLQGKEFMGFPIIAPEAIKEHGIQIVIIASRASGESIKKNLFEIAPECEYIDIYEELSKNGIVIDYNFFSEQNIYTRLYQLKKTYETAVTVMNKQKTLHELIARYLEIRDFSYAFAFAEEYCREKYYHYEQLQEMLQAVNQLLNKVKLKNKQRKEDILIHLIDSLRAIDVYKTTADGTSLKMFPKYSRYSSIFTEAYSTGPTTYESMVGTIKQKLSFDENVYEGSNFLFDFKEFDLLQTISNMDMPIHFYVAKDYLIMKQDSKIKVKENLHMSEKLWHVVCDMAESEKPTFNFIYYVWELHFPLLCGFHRKEPQIRHFSDVGLEDMSDFIEEQFEDCKAYTERQFGYYKDFINDDMINVFIGDHSQPVYDTKAQKPFFMYYNEPDKVSHIAFFIHTKKLVPKVYPQLISMLDFNSIMQAVITGHVVNIPRRDVIQYQYYNIQNKKLRLAAKQNDYMDYTEGIQCFLSEDYLYVRTGTGVQEVYRVSDMKQGMFFNLLESQEGQQYFKKIEQQFNTDFPDFWTVRKEV